jgi:Cytochrome c, mono- and diheme variants
MSAKTFIARIALAACIAAAAPATVAAEDAAKGRVLFRAHCVQCHGENADGRGPLAARYTPPPADITVSKRSDDYMLQIVTLGGPSMGRSAAMPEWGLELSGDEILDVVTYLRQVVNERKRTVATAQALR